MGLNGKTPTYNRLKMEDSFFSAVSGLLWRFCAVLQILCCNGNCWATGGFAVGTRGPALGFTHAGAAAIIPQENEQALEQREQDEGLKNASKASPASACPAPAQQQLCVAGMGRREEGWDGVVAEFRPSL